MKQYCHRCNATTTFHPKGEKHVCTVCNKPLIGEAKQPRSLTRGWGSTLPQNKVDQKEE